MQHYHYLTLEQRESLERAIRARAAPGVLMKAALERLHSADYGLCIECGGDIPFELLQADPGALHCRGCARLPTVTR